MRDEPKETMADPLSEAIHAMERAQSLCGRVEEVVQRLIGPFAQAGIAGQTDPQKPSGLLGGVSAEAAMLDGRVDDAHNALNRLHAMLPGGN